MSANIRKSGRLHRETTAVKNSLCQGKSSVKEKNPSVKLTENLIK